MKLGRIFLLVLLAAACTVPMGCQKTLFGAGDPYNESRLRRYWDGDSAKAARESRQRSQEMGFGFATGAGTQ